MKSCDQPIHRWLEPLCYAANTIRDRMCVRPVPSHSPESESWPALALRLSANPGAGVSCPSVPSVSQHNVVRRGTRVKPTHTVVFRPQRTHIANGGVPAVGITCRDRAAPAYERVEHLERGLVDGEDLGEVVPEGRRERFVRRESDEGPVCLSRAVVETPLSWCFNLVSVGGWRVE
jgi:hypothetical protein